MQSTPDLKQADPTPDQKQADPAPDRKQADPVAGNPALSAQELDLVARADERLKHAYEQIAHADEQIARFNEQISRLDHDVPRDRSPRLARGSPAGWPALRGLIGLLLAACIFGAAYASQFYGEAAKQMISRWAPQAVAASSLPTEKPQLGTQPAVQMAAADATLP